MKEAEGRKASEMPGTELQGRTTGSPSSLPGNYGYARNGIALLFSLSVIVAYAGLIPLGKWYPDEYDTFRRFREMGADFLVERMLGWSFRPFSEALIFLYSKAVVATGSQLMTSFLASLWLLLLVLVCLPALVLLGKNRSKIRSAFLLLSLTVLVLFLGSREIGEVFYWPQGSAAYLPALACLTFITFHSVLSGGRGYVEVLPMTLALAVLAFSVEVGAAVTIIYVLMFFALAIAARLGEPGFVVVTRSDSILALALLAAGAVFYFVLVGRAAGNAELFGDPAIAKHAVASLLAALERFPKDGLGLRYPPDEPVWFFAMLIAKVLLFTGAVGLFRQLPEKSAQGTARQTIKLIALLAALLGGSLFSLVAAFYQFGLVCCERHQTTRECMVVLALIIAAKLVAMVRPGRSLAKQRVSPILLLIGSTMFAVAGNASGLLSDYKNYSLALTARSSTWEEGTSNKDSMDFKQPPVLRIVGGQEWPPGEYDRQSEPVATIRIIMDYFDKSHLDMRPAGKP